MTTGRPQVIVVDAANVIGSRPDGWWRDRPGAARRLLTKLAVLQQHLQDTDIIINGAGNVTFNPPLDSALRTNVVGSNNII